MDFSDITRISFKLDSTWLSQYVGKQPEWGPIGYITYKRTYARSLPNNTTEEWWQTLERVVNGIFSIQKNHCIKNHLPWKEDKAQRTAQKMFKAMWTFKFLPPGRGLWAMGTPHINKAGGAALNNCAFLSTKHNSPLELAETFAYAMDLLMLGVGVGFDTLGAGAPLTKGQRPIYVHVIEDSREGWVQSIAALIESYVSYSPSPAFNYSKIRKAGEPIKGFGGISSGPEPLIALHSSIEGLIYERQLHGDTLLSSDIVDIMNLIGRCVVSGNVRRSAELAIGQPDDKEFITLKQDKDKLLSYRWASNNSLSVTAGDNYSSFVKHTQINGEPGYIWLDNMRQYGRMKDGPRNADPLVMGANPCVEQCLESYELCCLVETFPARHDSLSEFMDTLKLAYLYAKTVTLVPTHNQRTNSVMLRNRRIGCSQSGIIRAFNKHGKNTMIKWCDQAYDFIKGLDKQYSQWLCIPESIKKTSVKPSGTVSLLPGETPGIHYPISEYYIRRIRFAKNSEWVPILAASGYHIEDDVTQPDSGVVVSFPIKEHDFKKSESQASMWEQLANVALYQFYWSDNSVSATIKFKEHEKKDIEDALMTYDSSLKAISFLPFEDAGYAQLPYEPITEERYWAMMKQVKPENFVLSRASEKASGDIGSYCDSDKCSIK